jgi:hypothetical protein
LQSVFKVLCCEASDNDSRCGAKCDQDDSWNPNRP